MHRLTWLWVLTGLLLVIPSSQAPAQSRTFSLGEISGQFPSQGFEPQIAFWRAIFTQYGANQVVLHDTDDLRLIYEVVTFKEGTGRSRAVSKRQRRKVRSRIYQLSVAMNHLRTRDPNPENPDIVQQGILKVIRSAGLQPTRALFRKLRHNIHAQRGVKERFRKSIIRSGLYMKQMETVFESYGLPKMLVRLPHIESSFNFASRSSKGAAGIWQFMPRTGKAYKLRINRSVDERVDPIAATDAAARYLKDAYRRLGNWPLAITSYNHGQSGIARAKRRHGPNLLNIIAKYKSKSFRYASKNFYAEFLVAIEVSENYHTYFGPLTVLEPLQYQEILIDKSVHLKTFTDIKGLSQDILRKYNPQFKRHLWRRSRVLPTGFKIRVPTVNIEEARLSLAKAPGVHWRHAPAKVPPDGYRVRWGDSLTVIAQRFGTSVRAIQQLNDLENTRIYSGQVLRIPGLRQASASQNETSQSRVTGVASANSAASAPEHYRVRRGDSLITIAKRFGTSVAAIRRVNRLKGSRILTGQQLKIPVRAKVHANRQTHGTKSASGSPKPAEPIPANGRYRVQRGDTLSAIAKKFGISVQQLRTANTIRSHLIYPGQTLIIPANATIPKVKKQ